MSLLPVRTFGSVLLRTHSVSLAVWLAMATKKTNLSTSGKVEEDAGEYRDAMRTSGDPGVQITLWLRKISQPSVPMVLCLGMTAKEVFVPCALKLGGSKNASLSSMRSVRQWSAKGKR